MAVSSHFIIGNGNKNVITPCQDYAADSEQFEIETKLNMEMAVMSDGCSDGQRTDVGATMSCMTLMNILANEEHSTPYLMNDDIESLVNSRYKSIEIEFNSLITGGILQEEDLLASMGYVAYYEGTSDMPPHVIANLIGDGVMVVGYADGTERIFYHSISAKDEIPYYPIYQVSPNYSGDNSFKFEIETKHSLFKGKTLLHSEEGEDDSNFKPHLGGIVIIDAEELERVDYVMVLSDGIRSSTTHPYFEIVPELFKSKARHTNVPRRALNKMARTNQYDFYDDVSFACWMK